MLKCRKCGEETETGGVGVEVDGIIVSVEKRLNECQKCAKQSAVSNIRELQARGIIKIERRRLSVDWSVIARHQMRYGGPSRLEYETLLRWLCCLGVLSEKVEDNYLLICENASFCFSDGNKPYYFIAYQDAQGFVAAYEQILPGIKFKILKQAP